jgi:hypothetical protein
VKTAVRVVPDFPRSPYSFAFSKTAIKDVMRAKVTFRPMTFEAAGIVATFYEELSDVVIAVPAHRAIGEGQREVHSMPIAGTVVVETGPGAGRKKAVSHRGVTSSRMTNAKCQMTKEARIPNYRKSAHDNRFELRALSLLRHSSFRASAHRHAGFA